VLGLRFVPEFMQPAYPSHRGHPGVDTRWAVRMILLGYLYDLSDVRLCEEVGMHAGYRWFCRLDFHDAVPDRATLVKFRKWCREHGLWEALFQRIVSQCRDVGLLSGRHLMADSTQVRASRRGGIKSLREVGTELTAAAGRVRAEKQPLARDDEDHHHTGFHGKRYSNTTHCSGPGPDAQLYRKGKGKEAKLSYKAHVLADTRSRVIVRATATRVGGAEAQDGAQAVALLDQLHHHHGITPKTLCADTGYGNADTLRTVPARGVVPNIPLLSGKPPKIPV
jgi:IS5 family transposase